MSSKKGFLTYLAEAFYQYRKDRELKQIDTNASPTARTQPRWRGLLPTSGNVIFTFLVIGSLLWAQNVGAISLGAPSAATTSITGIPYQGRLADKNGAPLTQTVNMTFRLYAAASGGAQLWEEPWTGANSVQVSDGLFNVMLGSLAQIPQAVITGNNNLFLGITVGTDSEMSPRVQLGSVPFATQALTVPDGSITKAKLAGDVSLVPADGSITSAKLAPKSVGSKHFAPQRYSAFNPVTDVSTGASTDTGVQVTFTCEVDCTALIQHRGLVMYPVANARVDVRVIADNSIAIAELANVNIAGGVTAGYEPISGHGFVNLAAGSHTVSVRFECIGTCWYYGDPTGTFEHLDVLVFAQP